MKILFLQDNLINESLALCDLAGVLKNNCYEYDLLIEKEEPRFFKKIVAYNPTLVIIPISIVSPSWGLQTLQKVKQLVSKALIITAGTYPTFYPDIINNPAVDLVLLGEAETPMLKLLDKLENNLSYIQLDGFLVKQDGIIYRNDPAPSTEYSQLAIPDRELYYKYRVLRDFPLKIFASGRGCPNNCSYCFNPRLKKMAGELKPFTRKKPVDKLIAEIQNMKKYPMTHIHFSDDLFTYDHIWVREFCDKYSANFDIPFTINSKAEFLNEDIIIQLRLAGCKGIAIGIESGNENLRRRVMNRETTNKQLIEISGLIKKNNLILATFNMLNLPEESLDDIFATITLNQLIKADNPRTSLFLAIPGTKIYQHISTMGLLSSINNDQVIPLPKLLTQSAIYKEAFALSNMFPLFVQFPKLSVLIKAKSYILRNWMIQLLSMVLVYIKMLSEKKFFNIGIWQSIRYFLHTGGPKNKNTVYSTLL